ncbi:MAG TPA: hypothetical protein VF311_03850 [Terriglobales bacterium]|jgi:hypothetical protein
MNGPIGWLGVSKSHTADQSLTAAFEKPFTATVCKLLIPFTPNQAAEGFDKQMFAEG